MMLIKHRSQGHGGRLGRLTHETPLGCRAARLLPASRISRQQGEVLQEMSAVVVAVIPSDPPYCPPPRNSNDPASRGSFR